MNGRDRIGTSAGGILSLVIMFITFLFASLKMMHLASRHNPTVRYFVEEDFFEPSYKFNFQDENFMLAFALEGVFDE